MQWCICASPPLLARWSSSYSCVGRILVPLLQRGISHCHSHCNSQCNSQHRSHCNSQCHPLCNSQCNSNCDFQCSSLCNSQCNSHCNSHCISQCYSQLNSHCDSLCNSQCHFHCNPQQDLRPGPAGPSPTMSFISAPAGPGQWPVLRDERDLNDFFFFLNVRFGR